MLVGWLEVKWVWVGSVLVCTILVLHWWDCWISKVNMLRSRLWVCLRTCRTGVG